MLTFSERSLVRFAFGNIDHCSKHHKALIGLDWVQADLDREFATVFLATEQIAPGPHWARSRLGKKCLAQPRVITAEPFRDEHFYPLPQKLGARILEHPLGLSIHHDNLACSVDHHYGIRRGLDNESEAPFGSHVSACLVQVVEILAVRAGFTFPH